MTKTFFAIFYGNSEELRSVIWFDLFTERNIEPQRWTKTLI